jgi:hypothetical protein
MKAFRLFIWSVYIALLYALYVPVIVLSVASWPAVMIAWLLVGSKDPNAWNNTGVRGLFTKLQLAVADAADNKLAAANGFDTIVAFRAHQAAEKAAKETAARAAAIAAARPAAAVPVGAVPSTT